MNTKPNLKAIIDNNLDKTGHIPSKGQSTLPKGGWLDSYKHGGSHASSWMLTNPNRISTFFPRMQKGGDISIPDINADKWLMKYQDRGQVEAPLPKIGSKEYWEAIDAKQNRSDATRAVPAQIKGTRESIAEERKKELAERAAKRKDPGTFSKGNYAIEESLRAFPNSQGGIGEVFDEYINPAYFISRMASNLGNAGSKAYYKGDFSALPGAIAEPLALGALEGFGSKLKNSSKPIYSQSEITRGPINYWEEPGFAARNPNFDPKAYLSDINKFGSSATSKLPDEMMPKLIRNMSKEEYKKYTSGIRKYNSDYWKDLNKPEFNRGGLITDPRGQWAHPGQNTRIPSNNITMEGVGYPVLAKANNGMTTMMYPGQNYSFPGASYVDEYPMMQSGGNNFGLMDAFNIVQQYSPDPIVRYAYHEPTTSDAIISLADPTGLSNLPFTTQAIRNMIKEPSFGNALNVGWNLLGHVPFFGAELSAPGKVKKAVQAEQNISKAEKLRQAVVKPLKATLKTVDKVVTAPARVVNAGWKTAGVAPNLGAIGANTFIRGERGWGLGYDAAIEGLDKMFPGTPQQKYGGSWLNKYK